MIFVIRTTIRREKTVLDSLDGKIKNSSFGIKSILNPAELKGYLFLEGEEEEIVNATQSVPHVRGIIKKAVNLKELEQYFVEMSTEIKISEGDLVEVVGGSFKGEKAKVVRIKEQKKEAKIELIEAVVPIPITIKLGLLKPISKK